jgi:hypothetical protein
VVLLSPQKGIYVNRILDQLLEPEQLLALFSDDSALAVTVTVSDAQAPDT